MATDAVLLCTFKTFWSSNFKCRKKSAVLVTAECLQLRFFVKVKMLCDTDAIYPLNIICAVPSDLNIYLYLAQILLLHRKKQPKIPKPPPT